MLHQRARLIRRAFRATVRLFSRLAVDRRGVTAIEFGLISAPLFGLIFAIMQNSLAFFTQQGLKASIDFAGRQVMTGQAQNNAAIVDGPSFRNQLICNKNILPSFMTCSKIIVDVRPAQTFASLSASNVNSSFVTNGGASYDAGDPCDIMIVRAAYPMPSYLPLLSWGTSFQVVRNVTGLTTYNGQLVQMLSAAAVFRNEPFVTSGGGATAGCSS